MLASRYSKAKAKDFFPSSILSETKQSSFLDVGLLFSFVTHVFLIFFLYYLFYLYYVLASDTFWGLFPFAES